MLNTLREGFLKTLRQWPRHGLTFHSTFYSYEQLEGLSTSLAVHLQKMGVSPKSTVGICLPNGLELVLLHLAVVRLGGRLLPLNTRYTGDELKFILNDAGASFFFCFDRSTQELAEIRGAVSSLERCVDLSLESSQFQQWLSAHSGRELPEPMTHSDDVLCICYTSGTTGQPKGALLSHGNVVFDVKTLLTEWEVQASDRFLLTLPMFHVHGLMLGLYGAFLFGHDVIVEEKFDAERALDALLTDEMTMFMGVPTMYSRLVRLPRLEKVRNSQMRLFTSGSAPLSADLFHKFQSMMGHVIVERYGFDRNGHQHHQSLQR